MHTRTYACSYSFENSQSNENNNDKNNVKILQILVCKYLDGKLYKNIVKDYYMAYRLYFI